jgi:hypothetical protein
MITILILAYCIVGAIFTWGITKEYRQDTSNELDSFSPAFVKVCIIMASLGWPLLVAAAIYQKIKEEK